ncbi:MAG TPA: FAD-dependent thymidylate synthase [Phycisphaerales bacterium]|nr:FAD-dependent thymidylate synthase [Phycisphaerales bacterium]
MSEIAQPTASSPPAGAVPVPTLEQPGKPVAIDAPSPAGVSGKPIHRYGYDGGAGSLVDVMGGDARREIKVLDHGFVALVDAMPRLVPAGQTADQAIVQAARVSYGAGTKKVSEDRGLIRYLLRHRHTTPFEMVEFKFHISMPIFIARQWIRHRTANVNEYSGRYSVMPDRFYRPSLEAVRKQSAANRQGGEQRFDVASGGDDAATAEAFVQFLADSEKLYERYIGLTEKGVSRELARIGLPVSLYTQWYWKIDLHNLLHFLSLRMDSHAQEEIQQFSRAMYDLIQPIVPVTMEAWHDYALESVRLTKLEIAALREKAAGGNGDLRSDNKREQAEWAAKRAKLGF